MNKSKSGYTRTTGIMQGSIKAIEIENIQKTNICQGDIQIDEYDMTHIQHSETHGCNRCTQ